MVERADALRNDIEQTRAHLSGTVDELGDRVLPGRVAARRWDEVRGSVHRFRIRVMGAPSGSASTGGRSTPLGSATSSGPSGPGAVLHKAEDAATGTVSSIADAASSAPERVEAATAGNPLVAGALAFGVGVLVGSIAPPSREERSAAAKVVEPVKHQLVEAGQEVAGVARSEAQHAAEAASAAASDAVGHVRDEVGSNLGSGRDGG